MQLYAQLCTARCHAAKKAITNINLDVIFLILETINKASNTVKSDPHVFRPQVYLQYITKWEKKCASFNLEASLLWGNTMINDLIICRLL